MRRASRVLLSAGFLLGVLAPLALGQFEEAEIYVGHDIVRYGNTVYAYATTDLWAPTNTCDGWSGFCWIDYTSYAQADLYLDDYWMGGYWYSQHDGWASAWVYDDVAVGKWQLDATHLALNVWWRDSYMYEWFEGSISPLPFEPPTLTINPEISISGSQSVDDGGAGYFSVTVELGNPTGYQWSFENSSPAGNDPDVTFDPPTDTPTLTDAHWYAYPDSACSAGGTATYPIAATVGFDSGSLSDWTWLWVNAWWDPTGWTGAPSLPIEAHIDYSGGRWRVHADTQVQKVYSFAMIWVPGSSQFWYKAFVHEQEHQRQWEPGGLMGGLYNPGELRARLLGLSAETQAALEQLMQQTADVYMWEQAQLSNGLASQSEREAYAISDLYAPWYIYQGQCKGY